MGKYFSIFVAKINWNFHRNPDTVSLSISLEVFWKQNIFVTFRVSESFFQIRNDCAAEVIGDYDVLSFEWRRQWSVEGESVKFDLRLADYGIEPTWEYIACWLQIRKNKKPRCWWHIETFHYTSIKTFTDETTCNLSYNVRRKHLAKLSEWGNYKKWIRQIFCCELLTNKTKKRKGCVSIPINS